MIQTLYIMRHGHASNHQGMHDFDRELSEIGKKEVSKVAKWLFQNHPKPELVLVSPLKRAQQTFNQLQTEFQEKLVKYDAVALVYTSPLSSLMTEVSVYDESPILLIGHQPLLGEFTSKLLENKIETDFHTASLVCLRLEKIEKTTKSKIEWQINPSML